MILLAVLTKELRAYFGLFLAYAVVAVALSLAGFFFYTDLSFFMLWGGTDLEKGLWEFFFHDLRFVLLLLVPILTARSFAEEKKLGTLVLFWSLTWNEQAVNEVLLQALLQVSLFDRFYNFARGAIDSQEITFFLLFVALFLLLTWQALRSRRWRGKGEFSSLSAFLATP